LPLTLPALRAGFLPLPLRGRGAKEPLSRAWAGEGGTQPARAGRVRVHAGATLALLFLVCSFTAPLHAAPSGPLGTTASGEECRAAARPGMAPVPGMPAPLDVFCGTGKAATGSVWIDGLAPGSSGKAALEATAKRTIEGSSVARRLSCDAGEAIGGDQSVLVYSCTLKEGGWPQAVLMVGAGNRLYQAEGLPGMLPILGKAIDPAAGRPGLSAA